MILLSGDVLFLDTEGSGAVAGYVSPEYAAARTIGLGGAFGSLGGTWRGLPVAAIWADRDTQPLSWGLRVAIIGSRPSGFLSTITVDGTDYSLNRVGEYGDFTEFVVSSGSLKLTNLTKYQIRLA